MPVLLNTPQNSEYGVGRHAKRTLIIAKEAESIAFGLLRNKQLSPHTLQMIEMLASAGVLSANQLMTLLQLSPRTLRRYYHKHLLDYLPVPHELETLDPAPFHTVRLYSLGLVGQAIMQHQKKTVPSYAEYGAGQIVHDVLANQTVIRLLEASKPLGYAATWYGRPEAQVLDGKNCILEPDSLLVFSTPKKKTAFLLEYHNEDHQNRTADKVDRYERESRSQLWREVWPLDEFPTILVAFTKKIVADGYEEAIHKARARGLKCRYLGKRFTAQDDAPLSWWDFDQKKMVTLLP